MTKRRAIARFPRRRGDRFRAGKRIWSLAEDAQLRRDYPDTPTAKLARILRRSVPSVYGRAQKLGIEKSDAYLASPAACRLRRGDDVGKSYRFEKGHVPANKGLRRPGWGPGRMKATQFKKGRPAHEARNYRPIGSLRVTRDGVLERKVTDDPSIYPARRWVPVSRLVWEAERGPIPRGMRVAFRDGRRTTVESEITIDRLELVSMRELMRRNTVHNLPKPLAQAVQLLGAVHRQIRQREERAQP